MNSIRDRSRLLTLGGRDVSSAPSDLAHDIHGLTADTDCGVKLAVNSAYLADLQPVNVILRSEY
jgi:hypothetical protein